VACDPHNATAHSALIFSLDYDETATTVDQQQARRDWYEQCIAPRRIAALNSYRNGDPGAPIACRLCLVRFSCELRGHRFRCRAAQSRPQAASRFSATPMT
jgi:hypothetical protein